MTYAITILAAACCVLGFLLVSALVGGSEQRDALQAKVEHRDARIEDLENELRHRSMGNHPAGRALRDAPSDWLFTRAAQVPAEDRDPDDVVSGRALGLGWAGLPLADNVIALREACEERDAGHEGGEGA